VRHTGNQSYNVLSGANHDGYLPRPEYQLNNLNAFASILRSYCAGTDPVCALGNNVGDHTNYFQLYTEDAAKWNSEMVANAKGCRASPNSTSSSSSIISQTSNTPGPHPYLATSVTTVPSTPTGTLVVSPTAQTSTDTCEPTNVPSFVASIASEASTHKPTTAPLSAYATASVLYPMGNISTTAIHPYGTAAPSGTGSYPGVAIYTGNGAATLPGFGAAFLLLSVAMIGMML
jgi:hypothetical protein